MPPDIASRLFAIEQEQHAMREWKETIEESIAVQKEMIEVGRDIAGAIHVLGWIGKILKYLASVFIFFGIAYGTFKGTLHHE
jgi:hypothetical protein